ncbi:SIR2 family protein [Kitasatospora griseola]|uniref:hypothetical protein n=1 Tax=Kitasatospora griseola TaxID=2064 RepID=UPI00381A75CF
MFFPFPVIEQLTGDQVALWKEHFDGDGHERRRNVEEGIWRRTQDPRNAQQSGWSEDSDGRRRVVHYRYEYDVDHTFPVPRLVLSNLYLAVSFSAPAEEIARWRASIDGWLAGANWRAKDGVWAKGDLRFSLQEWDEHPRDERAGRATPPGFRSLDVLFVTDEHTLPRVVRNLPWDVLAGGMRVKQQRGNPAYADDLSVLADLLPFQVEIGCGTSIEAGIPPLHFLHEVYRVTARTDNALTQSHPFTMSPADDLLVQEMLLDPAGKAESLVAMFRACFTAEPTAAHRALRALHDAGAMVGPVITHNFDLLPARAGLAECFVRRYDQRVPEIELHPQARALLVIGLHADRRWVQERARNGGMKIVYLDPEGLEENSAFKEYLLEGPQDGDVIVRQQAIPALAQLCELLGSSILT